MNKSLLCVFCLIILLCGSCQIFDKDFDKAPTERKVEADMEILKNYMRIDKEANQYSVCITEEERLTEGISEQHLKYLLGNIAALNQSIAESVRKGDVVTLYLSKQNQFDSYTINKQNNLGPDFEDTCTPISEKLQSRSGSLLGYANINQGNWGDVNTSFTASDHVTSQLSISSSRGYWQVSFTCTTGTSAYGKTFTSYGTGYTYGSIQRYWWWTGGGSAPFSWYFSLGGPPGGQADGFVSFINTKK